MQVEQENFNVRGRKFKLWRSARRLSSRQKVFVASLVVVILTGVVVASVLLTKSQNYSTLVNAPSKIGLEDILAGKFSFKIFSTQWISENEYWYEGNEGIMRYNILTNVKDTVLLKAEMHQVSSHVKQLSPDKRYFLFCNNSKSLYRHSFYADYYVKDLQKNLTIKIEPPRDSKKPTIDAQIRYCGWSTKGSALVFVYNCDIYYKPSMETDDIHRITDNGVPEKVFNGVPDWVYEEEILGSTHALEFSSDGKYLAYVSFNATSVPYFKFSVFGNPTESYTSEQNIAYPKAGYPNPSIKINIVSLDDLSVIKTNTLTHPYSSNISDYYYSLLAWNGQQNLFVQWMNRKQTKIICMLYKPEISNGTIVHEHEVENGWIDDTYQSPYFSKDGSFYITMLPKDVAKENGKFRHIAQIPTNGSKTHLFLTDGGYMVKELDCYNKEEDIVYYRSAESAPTQCHVYSYSIKAKEKQCLTCGLIKDEETGANCTYYLPQFSANCSWVTLTCQGPFVPVTIIYSIKTKKEILMTNNIHTRNMLKNFSMPTSHYYTIKSDGYDIPVREIRPYNFDSKKKYAVLFDVYGGPNTQRIDDRFRIGFTTMFSSHEIIVVNFDARGSSCKGYSYMHAVYKNLGHYETVDALNLAKYLQKQSYVRPDRIAIWGWSYGGFYAASVLADSKGVINTAVSVAPVTDWRYYDTVYTERYMGLPTLEDNLKGYESTSLIAKVSNFTGKNFFLIHGTADDNVHFQNSAQLVAALIKEKIKFQSQYFPDLDHSISSGGYVNLIICDYLLFHLTGENLDTGFARYKNKNLYTHY